VPEYVEAIAYVKWLNQTFGYNLTVPEFLAEDSPWDEHQLDWHLTYASTFGDPAIVEAMRKHRERFRRKGVFSATYELGGAGEEN
jgi:hypothetical protein